MKKISSIVLNNFVNDSRVEKVADSLTKQNYEVTIYAIYEEGLPEFEIVNNITINRIKLLTKNWSKNPIIQLIKYIEFGIKFIVSQKNVDIIHCNDLGPLPLTILLKKIRRDRLKVVYDSHEYQTERKGINGFKKKIMEFMEKKLIKHADEVITVSESIAEEYKRKYNINKPKIILNCPPVLGTTRDQNLFREIFGINENKTLFLYQGGLSYGRGIEKMLDAFSTLKSNDFALVVMGSGALERMVVDYSEKNENIFHHPPVTQKELLNYTSSGDIGVLLYENTCLNHYFCLPNKLFEYMMAGLPVLVSNLFELKKFVEENNCGLVVDEIKRESIHDAINKILESDIVKMSKKSIDVSQRYNWESQEEQLLDIYRRLSGESLSFNIGS